MSARAPWIRSSDVDTVMNITTVSEITGAHYGDSHKTDVSLRVITDHIRASVMMMISDGILRRRTGTRLRAVCCAVRRHHGKAPRVNEPFLYQVVDMVVHENECQYPELREKQVAYITRVIRNEEENFAKTIDAGIHIFSDLLAEHQARASACSPARMRSNSMTPTVPNRPDPRDGAGSRT